MRVVIADDAAPLRAILVRLVRRFEHEVVAETSDGPELLRLLETARPHVIVIDGRLPPSGAVAILPNLRAAAPEAEIFVIASLGETTLVREAIAAGATGAIARPFAADRVAAVLRGGRRSL
jgi:DNA-binding NarL/FixJ family response regulator